MKNQEIALQLTLQAIQSGNICPIGENVAEQIVSTYDIILKGVAKSNSSLE